MMRFVALTVRLRVAAVICLVFLGYGFPGRAGTLPVTNGLALWLSADVGITTNSSGLVTDWADQSGMNHSATQSSSSAQPALLPGQLNGLPVVHFTGGQFFAVAGQVFTSQTFSIVAVINDQRTDTNYRELVSNWDNNSGNTGTSLFFGTTALNPVRARLTDNFGGADQGQLGVGIVSNPTSYFIFTGVSGANAVTVYQGTTNIAFRASPLTSRNLSGNYVIGRQGSGTFDEYWHGDIAELVAFNRELSLSELNQLWAALGAKYGATLAPPDIQSITEQDGTASIGFLVGPTTNYYYLQASDSLVPATWTNIGRLAGSLTVSNAVLVDPATNSPQRFYRLLLGP